MDPSPSPAVGGRTSQLSATSPPQGNHALSAGSPPVDAGPDRNVLRPAPVEPALPDQLRSVAPIEEDTSDTAAAVAASMDHASIGCLGLPKAVRQELWLKNVVNLGELRNALDAGRLDKMYSMGPDGPSFLRSKLEEHDRRVFKHADAVGHEGEGSCAIELLGLSPRYRHALQRAGLKTVMDVRAAIGQGNLDELPQIGARAIGEIETALARFILPPGVAMPAAKSASALSRLTTQATFADLLQPALAQLPSRDLSIFIARAAPNPLTLEALGDLWGITRERVRQIESKLLRRLLPRVNHPTGLRCLASLFAVADSLGPHLSRDSWHKALANTGLLGHFNPHEMSSRESIPDPYDVLLAILMADAEHGGRLNPPFDVGTLVMSGSTPIARIAAVRHVPKRLRRKVHRQAAYTGGIVLGDAAALMLLDEATARLAIQGLGYVEVEGEWFGPEGGSPTARSPLECAGAKMLAVRSAITFQEFADGLRRHIGRFYPSLAPQPVLERTLRLLGFEITDGSVTGDSHPNALSKSETLFVRIVSESGPVVTHAEVAERFIEAGLSLPAASALLSRSPVVRKVEQGLYTLVGTSPSWDQVKAGRQRMHRIDSDTETNHGLDGVVRYTFNLNSWGFYSGVVNCSRLPVLEGGWPILLDEEQVGMAQSDGEMMWGFSDAFRRLGARMGDRAELSFDTRARIISLRMVDASA